MKALVILLMLGGCAATAQTILAEPSPAPLPDPPRIVGPPIVKPPPVVQHYDAAKTKELAVVLKPDATPDHIDEIRAADRKARSALSEYGRSKSKDSMIKAREAVQALESILEQ